jgi:hypothetical protein
VKPEKFYYTNARRVCRGSCQNLRHRRFFTLNTLFCWAGGITRLHMMLIPVDKRTFWCVWTIGCPKRLVIASRGVHSIPCDCCRVYIRQTGHAVETRLKEHHRHIRLCHSWPIAA